MARQTTFTTTIHLRDFVDAVSEDPSQNSPNHVSLRTDINIFDQDGFSDRNIVIEPILTHICACLTREERDAYHPDTFFYAVGRFFTTLLNDGTLHMTIQAMSLMPYA